MKRIALCGTPEFACKFFDAVDNSRDYVVEFVITQCAKKKDRGYALAESAVATWARERKIECFEIDKIQGGQSYDKQDLEVKLVQVDCVLLFAFGKIIPLNWLQLPRMGWLNIHPSKLPLQRGPSPIQYSLLNGLKESALTLMLMDESMDTGNIIAQLPFDIREHHNATTLMREICVFGPAWVLENMKKYLDGKIFPTAQQGQATYSKLITKEDYVVQATDTMNSVRAKIKAFGYVYFSQLELKCFACEFISCCEAEGDGVFKIDVADGAIVPIYVQKDGKKIMHIRNYINGLRGQKNK